MANVITGAPITVLPANATIKRLTLTAAGVYETYSIPASTVAMYMYNRTASGGKVFEWNFDGSTTDYLTIEKGAFHYEEQKKLGGKTLYIRSANAGDIVEIISWA